MDATEDYIAEGGRYIYMGANGYYCNVAFRDDEPWVLECRKFGDGVEGMGGASWRTLHGDQGTKGRPWKLLGRPPQKLVGVGFISEGFGKSQFYRRMPDSYNPTLSWITEGIEGEVIGDFGLAYDGAAGVEIDVMTLRSGLRRTPN